MVDSLTETTDDVEPHERWTYWKDTAMAAVDGVRLGEASTFAARRTLTPLGVGVLVDTASSPLAARRPARKIARDGVDDVCLMTLLEGHSVIDQERLGESVLPTGGSMLFDLARPYAVAVPTFYRELRLYVPRAVFAARVGNIDRLAGLQIPAGEPLAKLFNGYLADVSAASPAMSRREADASLDGILHLLSGLVKASFGTRPGDDGRLSGETVATLADRYIASHLADPELDVATVARALGVSRSRLYEAFAGRGGIAAAIRDARLDRARLRLGSAADRHRTSEEIAHGCGFTDYPSYARAFRRRFGLSPRDTRGEAAGQS